VWTCSRHSRTNHRTSNVVDQPWVWSNSEPTATHTHTHTQQWVTVVKPLTATSQHVVAESHIVTAAACLQSTNIHTKLLSPVYTIQPVVKSVVKPVWQPVWQNGCIVYTTGCQTGCTTRFDNRGTVAVRSTRLSSPFDNRLDVCLHDTAGCQNGCTTGCIV